MFKTHVRGRLLITVCAASFAYAGALSAQTVSLPNYDFGVDQYLDSANPIFQLSLNSQWLEASAGVDLSNLSQTAVTQANSASLGLNLDLINGINIDQSFDSGDNYTGNGFFLFGGAGLVQIDQNSAIASTTIGDSFVSGSQVGVASLNTATVDVSNYDGIDALVGLTQYESGIGADSTTQFYDNANESAQPYDFILGVENTQQAVTAFGGNATIDGTVANPAYIANLADRPVDYNVDTPEFINSVQQAAVSLNTLRVTGDVNTDIALNDGQGFDVYGLSAREAYNNYYDDYTDASAFLLASVNEAIAYSPRGYSLVTSDPSVSNLDQVASLTMNGITTGVAGGTADYTVRSVAVTDYNMSADPSREYTTTGDNIDSQSAYFNYGSLQTGNEVELGNTAAATTYLGDFAYAGGNSGGFYMAPGVDMGALSDYNNQYRFPSEVGNTNVSDLSQVAALSVNGIANLGTGSLTIKDVEYVDQNGDPNQQDYAILDDNFVQMVSGFNYDYQAQPDYNGGEGGTGYINSVLSSTGTGNADIATVDQTGQFAFNSITSGGDLNGWVDGDPLAFGGEVWGSHIDQYVQTADFNLTGMNEATAYVGGNGDGSVSDLNQIASFQIDRVSAAGNIRADIEQDTTDNGDSIGLYANDQLNYVGLSTGQYWDEQMSGNLSGDNINQVASVGLNSISATGTFDADGNLVSGGSISAMWLEQQNYDLSGIQFVDALNTVDAQGNTGDIDLNTVSQVAQLSFNSVRAADSITGLDSPDTWGISQISEDYLAGDGSPTNEITANVDTGNVSLTDGSQVSLLNVNAVSAGSTLSGGVEQTLADFAVENINGVSLSSYDGNVAINGLTQTMSNSYNTVVAQDYGAGYIDQASNAVFSMSINGASAVTDYGTAAVDGAVQQAINRVNNIAIGQ